MTYLRNMANHLALSVIHMESQVPTFEPQGAIKIWLIINKAGS